MKGRSAEWKESVCPKTKRAKALYSAD